MDVYLRAARDIPADLFIDAVSALIDSWTYHNPPLPGDIRRVASELFLVRRRQQREARRQRERDECRANAMTTNQARELLAKLEAEPEPDELWKRTAREFSLHALRRVIARGDEPLPSVANGLSDIKGLSP